MLGYSYKNDAGRFTASAFAFPTSRAMLARITQSRGAAGINIEDFELRPVSPE